jgi:hypothetical protein
VQDRAVEEDRPMLGASHLARSDGCNRPESRLATRRAFALLERAARTNATVLTEGNGHGQGGDRRVDPPRERSRRGAVRDRRLRCVIEADRWIWPPSRGGGSVALSPATTGQEA